MSSSLNLQELCNSFGIERDEVYGCREYPDKVVIVTTAGKKLVWDKSVSPAPYAEEMIEDNTPRLARHRGMYA